MSAETAYCLQLFGFSTGCAGCLLTMLTMKHTDWRLWLIEQTSMYSAGITRVGIWKICFPPNLKGSIDDSVLCCHAFDFYEKFFPVEMKIGQILMIIASFLAFVGLVLSFLIPWNIYCRSFTRMQARCLVASGGLFSLLSSICVLVPISWNVYSVSVNKAIPFPDFFGLPKGPTRQSNGSAILLGYISSVLLFISGLCVITQRSLMRPIRVIPM